MRTKHPDIKQLKEKATILRYDGFTYPQIEKTLGVNRSTLSGWLSTLVLSDVVQEKINQRKVAHLIKARVLASAAHRTARLKQIEEIQQQVNKIFNTQAFDGVFLEGLLAMLHLGDGFKRASSVGFANSNPKILAVFVELLRRVYQVEEKKFRCFLFLRFDQNIEDEMFYWSHILDISFEQFRKPQLDRRTLGKKTWIGYHGVCAVYYYDAKIGKRIKEVGNYLLERVLMGN